MSTYNQKRSIGTCCCCIDKATGVKILVAFDILAGLSQIFTKRWELLGGHILMAVVGFIAIRYKSNGAAIAWEALKMLSALWCAWLVVGNVIYLTNLPQPQRSQVQHIFVGILIGYGLNAFLGFYFIHVINVWRKEICCH